MQDILIEVSARKGAYIATLINLKISSSTALRLVEQMPLPIIESVNVLGIDDWAIRKGTTYGTILVDNETQRVIGVLKGRDGSLLKDWLKDHPEVKVVTRDRASSFSKAVIDVLPDCVQVADRFHLYKNMSDCAYEVIKSEYKNLSNSLCQQDEPQEYKTEVQICTTNVGTSGMTTKNNATTIVVKLVDRNQRTLGLSEYAQKTKEDIMKQIPGVRACQHFCGKRSR